MPLKRTFRFRSLVIIIAALLSATVMIPRPAAAGMLEPNDAFGTATVLPAGVLTVSDTIDGGLRADTVLGFFSDDTFATLLSSDDDSSPFGIGTASALTFQAINPDGSIPLAVTGYADFGFVGDHGEEGPYEVFADVFDAAGNYVTTVGDFGDLLPGSVDTFVFSDPGWIGGTFDAYTDNYVDAGPDPLDFWVFTGLTPGSPFIAEITFADFDSELGWFDATGTLITVDDDGGVDLLSRIEGLVPADGQLVMAVTAFPDDGVMGLHGAAGSYTLAINGVPEPSSFLTLILGLLTGLAAWRRR